MSGQGSSSGESHRTENAAATEALAASLASEMGPGDVVFISGDLGAGKTTFVRGAARALGVREPVTSPTFTIGQRYEGRVPVAHLDLYRLGCGLADEEPGLLDDYITPAAIAFVEWAEIGEPELGEVTMRVRISHAGEDAREIEVVRSR
ncbi:MAG: tRNA (adenosine(37)-N6)-threonylcarbamoyltransferase complex ATPase subunit type 1 TsaE [Solirubrobacterales bacterium]|nr:tRNA (adenosine(37)-N6)-threonylcarbamoyltransferase complex ATPase subunit type 1 TsaE [Solirubrobacterales bacterium]